MVALACLFIKDPPDENWGAWILLQRSNSRLSTSSTIAHVTIVVVGSFISVYFQACLKFPVTSRVWEWGKHVADRRPWAPLSVHPSVSPSHAGMWNWWGSEMRRWCWWCHGPTKPDVALTVVSLLSSRCPTSAPIPSSATLISQSVRTFPTSCLTTAKGNSTNDK